VEVIPLGGQDAKDIERTIVEFAVGSNRGLITVATPLTIDHRNLIISLAARHRLPATYPFHTFVTDGGLISYGPDSIDPQRQAAGYVDRILKGEKPADLPVQNATKFEMAINLKTAKALGLTVPPSLLSRANEIIE
jgi:putative ABC transport system substrate-binding protein